METPRSAEKEASIGWNGVVLAEQVLESRGVAAPRMATLDGLLELLGIAEKYRVSGGGKRTGNGEVYSTRRRSVRGGGGQAPAHCTSNRTGSLAQFRARDRLRRPRLSGARWR